ncbi:uncharacterized protein A1O9_08434 [Exophiala aquamarina CBS 119918]|uniref:Glycosyl hydrolase family 13 catalytic domain-containing protein n=1 Tax=Exophiala aquamarina CBS 119918 TaxID=1182545 RepID=A0A072P6E1_9EURO|nr:uncharacterized protein A1O9_08434 [Exophiala aquamarina CBS 119918]KEF55684.1 hypothetical protein A1O9_08434 [Exophiala aquamarina CBS 119918]
MPLTPRWWHNATGYQVYPASFRDSNGDGIGDLPGIISSLDYLKDLGVDFIWLSPTYDSPQHDMGYDVSDYEAIYGPYGTMDDMDTLIRELHARGMRIVLDLVVNHTSSEHAWFKASRQSKDNKFSDWYIWRDPKEDGPLQQPLGTGTARREGRPPNNWRAAFGGSVWTYAEERGQYYMHLALPEQPDLNWENPEVRKAVFESAIGFWLKKGVDGFRADVVNCYCKDQTFPDAPVSMPNEAIQPMLPQHILNGPRIHEWLQQMRTDALERYGGEDVLLLGELPATGMDEITKYMSAIPRELDMVFDLDFLMVGNDWASKPHEFQQPKLPDLKDAFVKTQGFLSCAPEAWTSTFLENHDFPRSIHRFGPGISGDYQIAAAKMLALFLATLSGTLFIYQGQEIGMRNVSESWTQEDFRDRAILEYFTEMELKYPGDRTMQSKALAGAHRMSRDNARTPMQWSSASPNAGFSAPHASPWIKVNENYAKLNVADQLGVKGSVLEFWRELIKFRKENADLFIEGQFELLDRDNERTFTYLKKSVSAQPNERKALVVLNFSNELVESCVPEQHREPHPEFMYGSAGSSAISEKLKPWEGRVYSIAGARK